MMKIYEEEEEEEVEEQGAAEDRIDFNRFIVTECSTCASDGLWPFGGF